jgi:hypothetical protein
MNGELARTIKIPLTFIGQGRYESFIVRDRNEEPAAVRIEQAKLSRGAQLTIELRVGGGFIARFSTKHG